MHISEKGSAPYETDHCFYRERTFFRNVIVNSMGRSRASRRRIRHFQSSYVIPMYLPYNEVISNDKSEFRNYEKSPFDVENSTKRTCD